MALPWLSASVFSVKSLRPGIFPGFSYPGMRYFQGFDWIGLCRRTLVAPILPKVSGPTDVSNFDKYPDQFDLPPDENSGWDIDF
ncbi:unnamed protein product [Schistocephalus solidus]|uniref:AGC-kinase C-terminal domain-containing protein n=1 Tax=Schistocephalus solidus TaxID=70667 RepID=A0A183T7M1_SCHSO|nr:unnamed protein product [Schistocephalus solidus]